MRTAFIGGPAFGAITSDAIPAGYIGEELLAELLQASAISLTTGTVADVCSKELTPGHWRLTGFAGFLPAATTSITRLLRGWSTTSATLSSVTGHALIDTRDAYVPGVNAIFMEMPSIKVRISVPTTYYLVVRSTHTVSTLTAWGKLHAERCS